MTPSRQQVCLLIASLWGCVHGFTPANKPPRRTATTALPATRREFAAAAASILTWAGTSSAALASSEGNNSPIVMGDERLMAPKAHGTTEAEVQADLLYSVNRQLADKICSFNRRFAEPGGSWEKSPLASVMAKSDGPVTFYDSVTGKPLFRAPVGRSVEDFLSESAVHGWPSFRDSEVVWENVRVLRDGETVSVDGTHLGHDLPDRTGNRYCINLVCIAGRAA